MCVSLFCSVHKFKKYIMSSQIIMEARFSCHIRCQSLRWRHIRSQGLISLSLFLCVRTHNTHLYVYTKSTPTPLALYSPVPLRSGRYPYLRQRRSKCWGCGAVVRPISRTNGGLTALCALREEDQPPAAGRPERAWGWEEEEEGRRQHRLEEGSSCGLH